MRSTTTYSAGQVVVVNIGSSNQAGFKVRPALVVSTAGFHRRLPDLVVCPISSQPRFYRRPGVGDHPLKQWESAGLRHPSTVRVSKVLAVEKEIVKRTLGVVSSEDLARVREGLRKAFGL